MKIAYFLMIFAALFFLSCHENKNKESDEDNVKTDSDTNNLNDEDVNDADFLTDKDINDAELSDEEEPSDDNETADWIVNSSIVAVDSKRIYVSGYISSGASDTFFLKKFDEGEWSKISESDEYISAIIAGENDEVAIMFAESGLEFISGENFKIKTSTKKIWGASFSDLFFTGDGEILHSDGTEWVKMHLPDANKVNCIWGTASDNIYAAGEKGAIFHYDGVDWSAMESGTEEELNSIWGSSENDIYIVGGSEHTGNHIILHFNGEKWETILSDSGYILLGIDGTSKENIVAVGAGRNGENIKSAILHYDGEIWQNIPVDIDQFLWDVAVLEDGSFFVVGPANTIERIMP